MEESLRSFPEQFTFDPVIENSDRLPNAVHFIVGGMGGSHLAADLLQGSDPTMDVAVHSDYGLLPEAHLPPARPGAKDRTLFIASSYSGNTEETFDFATKAHEHGYHVACIATGGTLIDFAHERGLPFILLPDTGIQPRTAIGFSLVALAAFIQPGSITHLRGLAETLDPEALQAEGEALAGSLDGFVPIVYSSERNRAIASNWKIKFNETAKIPSFYNVFPELNHNEMTGFDVTSATEKLSQQMRFVFLSDDTDNQAVQKRMIICEEVLESRGFEVIRRPLVGDEYFVRTLSSILTADWAAFALAKKYNVDPEHVPLVEEFKKKLQNE